MIISKIHQQFSELNDLRAREIRVDKQLRKVFCTFSYPNVGELNIETRKAITEYTRSLVPTTYSCSVSFVNDQFTELSLKKLLNDILKNKYPLFAPLIKNNMYVSISGREINVEFKVNSVMNQNIETADLCGQLEKFFKEYTCYEIKLTSLIDDSASIKVDLAEQEKLVHLAVNRELLKPSRYFTVSNVEKHIGKVILSSPMYISDIRKATDSCVICGTVSNKSLKASKSNPNMHICKFTLTDASGGSITCVVFVKFEIADYLTIKEKMGKTDSEALTLSRTRTLANDKKMKKVMDIYDSMSVIVRGKVSFNSYSEQLEMCVYDICKCIISPISKLAEFTRSVADEYVLIKPSIYKEYLQTTFVDKIIGKSILSDKTYVVLHINATGYNIAKDKIFAICGVKITDGHISEQFFTYVNPEADISNEVLSKAKTSVEKIVFFPTITEIISDLYKFLNGCEIVGINLPQTLDLLNYYAAPIGYQFANLQVNQTELLSNLFDNSIFVKKPNCTKLEDVAKTCKVNYDGSKLCFDTAVTVARSMSVLASRVK